MAKATALRINIDQELPQELFEIGDTVRLMDSPYDKIKRGAKGKVIAIHGNIAEDKHTQIDVRFKLEGAPFTLSTSACRYRFVSKEKKKDEELPDADNNALNSDEDED